ncbi:17642_t:CDS:2 [Cetraspora pellucida]|uniref:17642_t:CDS:1 n=1 Tax=Cetraspora pellucida TaxID=1433469 RepID=A0A9N9EE32_9GLOM|nr:17642_t:CDS:2 [Cetraspora pellucida]
MVHCKFMETVSDNGREQDLSVDSSSKVYCEDCDKARSNGGNHIENQEDLDRVKPSTETHIKLPFPPTILPEDLVNDLLKSKSQSPKMLNEFFIYRKVFVQELRKQKLRPKMTRASKLASISWHQESSNVKNEYRRLAREVEKLYQNARNERLRSQNKEKVDEQNTIFTNPTTTNSTIAVSDIFSNGNGNDNDKIEPYSPIEAKSCTSSGQSTNTSPHLHNTTFVPINDLYTQYTNTQYTQYDQNNVYMPGHDGSMHLLDFSNSLPYPNQATSFEFVEFVPTYSLEQNIFIQDPKNLRIREFYFIFYLT